MAASAYTTPTHTSSACMLEVSGTPEGRMPFTAPIVPSAKPRTFSSKMVFNALSTWSRGKTCGQGDRDSGQGHPQHPAEDPSASDTTRL